MLAIGLPAVTVTAALVCACAGGPPANSPIRTAAAAKIAAGALIPKNGMAQPPAMKTEREGRPVVASAAAVKAAVAPVCARGGWPHANRPSQAFVAANMTAVSLIMKNDMRNPSP
jgi:hypothetical protein